MVSSHTLACFGRSRGSCVVVGEDSPDPPMPLDFRLSVSAQTSQLSCLWTDGRVLTLCVVPHLFWGMCASLQKQLGPIVTYQLLWTQNGWTFHPVSKWSSLLWLISWWPPRAKCCIHLPPGAFCFHVARQSKHVNTAMLHMATPHR